MEAVPTEDEKEPRGSQQATGSKRKRHRTNRIVEDEAVGSRNEGELNECTESQHGNRLARKRSRALRTDDANAGRAGASQSSSDMRRVTRSSARLL